MKAIHYIQADLFDYLLIQTVQENPESHVFVPHVCNDVGAFGAGFASVVAKRYPSVAESYRIWSRTGTFNDPPFQLGAVQFLPLPRKGAPRTFEWICNMIAQEGIGGQRPLRYNALAAAMDKVQEFARGRTHKPPTIICPVFGAGLAAGSWPFIATLIEDCWLRRDIPVTVCYLPGQKPDGAP